MSKKQSMAGIAAGIGGGSIFLLFFPILGIALVPSLLAGAGAFTAILLIGKGLEKKPTIALPAINDPALVQEAFETSTKVAMDIKAISQKLNPGAVRSHLEQLSKVSLLIAADVKEDPKDAREALRFMSYYGQTAVKIATLYRDLQNRGASSAAIRESEVKVESNLKILVKAFEIQLVKLQEDNLMDLDTELKVLSSTLEMEGMGDAIREHDAEDKG